MLDTGCEKKSDSKTETDLLINIKIQVIKAGADWLTKIFNFWTKTFNWLPYWMIVKEGS